MIIDEVTRGQADTVVKMLEHFNITDSFLVKDSDSHFEFSSPYAMPNLSQFIEAIHSNY